MSHQPTRRAEFRAVRANQHNNASDPKEWKRPSATPPAYRICEKAQGRIPEKGTKVGGLFVNGGGLFQGIFVWQRRGLVSPGKRHRSHRTYETYKSLIKAVLQHRATVCAKRSHSLTVGLHAGALRRDHAISTGVLCPIERGVGEFDDVLGCRSARAGCGHKAGTDGQADVIRRCALD